MEHNPSQRGPVDDPSPEPKALVDPIDIWRADFARVQPENAGLQSKAGAILEDINTRASAVTLRSQGHALYDEFNARL